MSIKKITYRSIKTRFISYLIQVMVGSVAAFILTILMFFSLIDLGAIRRADYYEQQVPIIRAYIEENKENLLNPYAKERLESVIDIKGSSYQVYNIAGDLIYQDTGAMQIPMLQWDEANLLNEQRKHPRSLSSKVIRYFPIVTEGTLQGAVVIAYRVANSSEIDGLNWIARYMNLILLMLPFIYLFIFIFIYANKFIRSIKEPLQVLEQGMGAIQSNDLDFELQCESEDELGKLTQSFEKMRYTLKETLEANWAKEEERKNLINALAHDLRTPMTIIKGYTEMLLDEEDSSYEQVQKSVKAIDKNADRLIKLIEDINRVNKLQQLDHVIQKKDCDLSKILKAHLEDYEVIIREREIALISEMKLSQSTYYVDEHAILEILDNLMSNSIRFTPHSGWVKIMMKDEEGYLQIVAQDNGCGFSKEDLSQAAKLFYQGDAARTSGIHYGIGLYMVQTLANKMQGEMQLYNREEGGAGVKVKIRLDSDIN